ncbi:MAG: 50S ribosomal protein L31 [Rickettsiaceae bacterium H1]|nr:50S ribosomal protein L31 [Rickettsiaceae bacterium H1]
MKKGIHPKLRKITIKMTNGKSFKTMSTYQKSDTIVLDVDRHNHPAWTGVDKGAMENVSSVAKYRKKFGNFNLFDEGENSQEDNKNTESQ